MKRTTLATIKTFVKRNAGNLYVKTLDRFDGMVDGVRPVTDTYRKVDPAAVDMADAQTLGIPGAWFVRDSRDWFTPFGADGFEGFEVSNCCGSFILCVPAAPAPRFKVEVQADNTGTWAGNGLTFETRELAEAYARDLAGRWMAVRAWHVVEAVPAEVTA